jgi:hypothetical protein
MALARESAEGRRARKAKLIVAFHFAARRAIFPRAVRGGSVLAHWPHGQTKTFATMNGR